jgi:hypothetical protein
MLLLFRKGEPLENAILECIRRDRKHQIDNLTQSSLKMLLHLRASGRRRKQEVRGDRRW